jgi:hypothetical protein
VIITDRRSTTLDHSSGWLDAAVLAGQLSGDALPQIVEMTH